MRIIKIHTLIMVIISSMIISGCLSNNKGENEMKEDEIQTYWVHDSHVGWAMALTNNNGDPFSDDHNLRIQLRETPIKQVILNITYLDANDGTEPDVIEGSTMTGVNNLGEEIVDTIPGGIMPYSDQFILVAEGDTYFTANFTIVDEYTVYPSEDQWIGPIFWVGTTDDGFEYQIDISIEYIGEEPEDEE